MRYSRVMGAPNGIDVWRWPWVAMRFGPKVEESDAAKSRRGGQYRHVHIDFRKNGTSSGSGFGSDTGGHIKKWQLSTTYTTQKPDKDKWY